MKCLSSFRELDVLGEAMSKDYLGKARLRNTCCFDIEGFVLDYLGLPIAYECFAEEDSSKLGFLSNGKTPLLVRRKGGIVPVVFPRDTIVIEKALLKNEESCRRRFTLAHEAAHKILEKHIPDQNEVCFRSEYDGENGYKVRDLKRIFSLNEALANRLGAAVLMPSFLVMKAMDLHNDGRLIAVYEGGIIASKEKIVLQKMGNDLGVSYTALLHRLKELKLLDVRPVEEYIAQRLEFGGGMK